jgi:hypothetical protein
MLRTVHVFDVRPGTEEPSFIEWLDGMLWEHSRRFGCLERKTWRFLDGIEGDYDSGKPVHNRPRYLNEAFWPDQQCVERFRSWLRSPEARDFRNKWFSGVRNHTVLRYLDYEPRRQLGDD